MIPDQELPDFEATEDREHASESSPPHRVDHERITKTFESWRGSIERPISQDEEAKMLGIRDAVGRGDVEAAKKELESARTESNWLYEELMKHPEISAIFRELSIMGF